MENSNFYEKWGMKPGTKVDFSRMTINSNLKELKKVERKKFFALGSLMGGYRSLYDVEEANMFLCLVSFYKTGMLLSQSLSVYVIGHKTLNIQDFFETNLS